ncbi:PEP-CTERM/exosortase system-associated acyltransferase [Halochromatium roseum]|uniref:PEP-CTERM/exosortase system-associated acyltransferase n=1 Tax=Halochromatium roseum TaxID=391920 RepID=UPI001912114A
MNDLLNAFSEYFNVIPANSPDLLEEAYRLRFQVYSQEIKLPGFESWRFSDQMERDEYDGHAVHCLIQHRPSEQLAGVVRLVLAKPGEEPPRFPIEAFAEDSLDASVLVNMPRETTAEISRLILSSAFRRRKGEAATEFGSEQGIRPPGDQCRLHFPHPVLALMVATMRLSVEHEVTHWLAGMEPRLNRLLGRFGLDLMGLDHRFVHLLPQFYWKRRKALIF